MEALKSAEEIAQSRPPDSVHYTEWLPVLDDPNPPTTEEWIGEGGFIVPRSYRKQVTVMVLESRKRIETWKVPSLRLPIIMGPHTAIEPDQPTSDSFIIIRDIPSQTVARSETEYRRRPRYL